MSPRQSSECWLAGFAINLVTATIAAVSIGIGIDFAIHLNAAFSTARSNGKNVLDSLRSMYGNSGPGVITGALTTSAAFFALAFTGHNFWRDVVNFIAIKFHFLFSSDSGLTLSRYMPDKAL